MADDDCVAVAAQCFVKSASVSTSNASLIEAVGRDASRCVPTGPRGNSSVSGIGELGQEVTPRACGIREPMQADRKRTLARFDPFDMMAIDFGRSLL